VQVSKKEKETIRNAKRYTVLIIIMFLIFSALTTKLTLLQIVKGEEYQEKANSSSIREIPEFAPRGNIIDKKGNVLASSTKSYTLIYNETEDNKKSFFDTMTKTFKILDDNGEKTKDDFELKVDPFRFEFRADTDDDKKWAELRFKKDRGFHGDIQKALFNSVDKKLTDEESQKVDQELLKITPEQVFYKLVKNYQLYKLIDNSKEADKKYKNISGQDITKELLDHKYTLEELRKYIVVKDALEMQKYSGYKPVNIAVNIKENTSFIFYQRLSDLPGIDVSTQPLRLYPNGEVGSAFLGYISKIQGNTSKYEERGYDPSTDYIGMAGLENAFEDRLKGSKGGTIVKLNRQGRVVQELGKRESYPGQNLQLTIDLDIQRVAEQALDKTMQDLQKEPHHNDGTNTQNANRGAAIVLDVNTGGVLALASRPGYDPNIFSTPGKLDSETYKQFFSPDYTAMGKDFIKSRGLDTSKVSLDSLFKIDSRASTKDKVVRQDTYDVFPKPLYNYATLGMTQPGSTFKALTAVAGLETGVITKDSTINDLGVYYNNNVAYGKCWIYNEQGRTHGNLNVIQALAQSCNYYFYEVGNRLRNVNQGVLADYAWKFGLGVDPKGKQKPATGIEIRENFGQVSNYESDKNIIINLKINQLTADLKKNGLDIEIHQFDSEEVVNLKAKFIDNFKNFVEFRFKGNFKDEGKFTGDMRKILQELAQKSPISGIEATKGNIEASLKNIAQTCSDGYTEINTPGNIYNAAIGQGYSRFTPLQLANYMATLVNGGHRYKVHLVDKFTDANGEVIEQVQPEVIEDMNLKKDTVAAVINGLRAVNEDGTASYIFNGFPIPNGGKTGSATFNVNQHDFGREAFGVYVGFAPIDKPQIAVAVVIYDGGHGGYVAPVVRAVYEAYFKDQLKAMNYTFTFPGIDK